jgi:hypothetical protein
MYEAAASCKDIARTPVTNWEPQCVTLAGYRYAVRHGMKVQHVAPFRLSHFQRYSETVRGNFTNVYPTLRRRSVVARLLRLWVGGMDVSLLRVLCFVR